MIIIAVKELRGLYSNYLAGFMGVILNYYFKKSPFYYWFLEANFAQNSFITSLNHFKIAFALPVSSVLVRFWVLWHILPAFYACFALKGAVRNNSGKGLDFVRQELSHLHRRIYPSDYPCFSWWFLLELSSSQISAPSISDLFPNSTPFFNQSPASNN